MFVLQAFSRRRRPSVLNNPHGKILDPLDHCDLDLERQRFVNVEDYISDAYCEIAQLEAPVSAAVNQLAVEGGLIQPMRRVSPRHDAGSFSQAGTRKRLPTRTRKPPETNPEIGTA